MAADLFDCPWCGSAQSIEHGLCQVCLMEFDVETKIINLPSRPRLHGRPSTDIRKPSQGAAGVD